MTNLTIAATLALTAALTAAATAAETTPVAAATVEAQAATGVLTPAWQSIGSSGQSKPRTSTPGPLDRQSIHDLRVKKCNRIVATFYDYRRRDGSMARSNFLPYVEYFVTEHERLGMGEDWWWSLAYSAAGIGLRCHFRARNGCAGPTDRPGGSTNPKANIRAHCHEWVRYYRQGIEGYEAAKHVFYPRCYHDWLPSRSIRYMHRTQKHGRIWQVHLRHRRIIKKAYQQKKLP